METCAILALLFLRDLRSDDGYLRPFAIRSATIADCFPVLMDRAGQMAGEICLPFTLIRFKLRVYRIDRPITAHESIIRDVNMQVGISTGRLATGSAFRRLFRLHVVINWLRV